MLLKKVQFNKEEKCLALDRFYSIVIGKCAYLDAKSESRNMGFHFRPVIREDSNTYTSQKLYVLDAVNTFI